MWPSLVLLLAVAVVSVSAASAVPNPFSSTASSASAGATPPFASSTASSSSASSTLTPQAVSSLFVLEALQRHNSSGTLPPIPRLNELLRQANGKGALQVPESATAFESSATYGGGGAVDAFSALLAQYGAGAGTATGFPASRPPMFGAGTDAPIPSGAPVPPAGAPAAPPDLSPLLGMLLAPQESVNSEMAMAVRAVRFGLYDAIYGLLNFAGYQILVVGNIISIVDINIGFILFAVGEELQAIGYLALGIRGVEETEVAIAALQELLAKQAVGNATPAVSPGAVENGTPVAPGAGSHVLSPPPAEDPNNHAVQHTEDTLAPQRAYLTHATGVPYSAFQTFSSGSEEEEAVKNITATAQAMCPSFLYASWLRLELDNPPASSGSSASTSSVLLRFTESSFERLTTTVVHGQTRVQQQKWTGGLQVECEWKDDAASPTTSAAPPATTIMHVMDSLAKELSLPTRGAVDLTIQVGAANAPTLRFTYLPVSLQHSLAAVLVERTPNGHERAYVRV